MSEVPLYRAGEGAEIQDIAEEKVHPLLLQGYLAHKKHPPP